MVANRESSRNNRNSRNCKRKITNAGNARRCKRMLKKPESAKNAGKPQNAAPEPQQSYFIRTSGE